jgi:protein TonB
LKLLVTSTYGKAAMLSLFLHVLLLAAFLAMPAAPAKVEKNLAEVEILPVPPEQQPLVEPPKPEEKTDTPPQQEAAPTEANQLSNADAPSEAEPAPQADALAGEEGMPNSVALRSGKGSGIPRVTGIPRVKAAKAGSGSGGAAAAAVVYAPKPAYPATAKKDGWEGSVMLQIRVHTDGSVTVLSVLESEREDVSAAAVQAVSNWQYSPDRNESGIPVSSVRNIRVNFDLRDAV